MNPDEKQFSAMHFIPLRAWWTGNLKVELQLGRNPHGVGVHALACRGIKCVALKQFSTDSAG